MLAYFTYMHIKYSLNTYRTFVDEYELKKNADLNKSHLNKSLSLKTFFTLNFFQSILLPSVMLSGVL